MECKLSILFIIAVSVALLFIGCRLIRRYDGYDNLGFCILIVVSVLLLVIFTLGPTEYYVNLSNIQAYHAIKDTIAAAREDDVGDIERAALANKIIGVNAWLAEKQYWNRTIVDPFIPDEVMDLEPLK